MSRTLEIDKPTAKKLARVCVMLDKRFPSLGGEKVNLLTQVWYGINGMRMDRVKEKLVVL